MYIEASLIFFSHVKLKGIRQTLVTAAAEICHEVL